MVYKRLEHEIVDNHRRGTVQDFCRLLSYEDEFKISAALSRLVSEGKAEMKTTKMSHFNGGVILEGVYSIKPEYLVSGLIKDLEKYDMKYAKIGKINLEKMKEANARISKMILERLRSD